MSSLTVEEEQKWVPSNVLVTVLRGRGLRGKGKHGTSDVYTIIQLAKEKYSTGVAEKTTEPEWREECSFELQPGVLESSGRGAHPAGSRELILTVMHRALIGQDAFLGQAVIQLDKVFHESRCQKNQWYRLHSKTGKKEKERGEIQVTIQFTRNNLTASMYDLVMKDKSSSTFSKLKERIKGKRRSSDDDSSSAVLPGGYGSLYRLRQRLPSDGGGEEEYEDDEGGEARRSKMRTFFFRGKLRKSSDTRSSTSLGSESSESSSRGGSLSPTAGISVVVSDLSNSPSNSSNLTVDSPDHTANTSPKSSSLKCEFGDDAGEISIAVPQHTVCVNGSHAYNVQHLDPGSGKPAGSLGLLQKSSPHSVSLQNLSTQPFSDLPKGPVGDGRRWSFDRPCEEEKAAIAAALEISGPMVAEEEEESECTALPKDASEAEPEILGKKQKRNLFSQGRSESAGKSQSQSKDVSEQVCAVTEEKQKGWFGSKESHSKPSSVVSPKLAPSPDPHPAPTQHPVGSTVDSSLHHTNPFWHSPTTPPPISPCNPFFSLLNPFNETMQTQNNLNALPPPLPYLSSSRPPITQLFPQPSDPSSAQTPDNPTRVNSIVGKRPLPPIPAQQMKDLKLCNPFKARGGLGLDSEWDESFEAFAAGRLQSPEVLGSECRTQRSLNEEHLPERRDEEAAKSAELQTRVYESLHHLAGTVLVSDSQEVLSHVRDTNAQRFDIFPQLLETIPENKSFEFDDKTGNTQSNSPILSALIETNNKPSNDLIHSNLSTATFPALHAHAIGGSPDPTSSGLGSSAEDDGFSCLSSHSDKFSGSSCEEAESCVVHPELICEKNTKPPDSKDDVGDESTHLSSVNIGPKTLTQRDGGDDEKMEWKNSETGSKGGDGTNISPPNSSELLSLDDSRDETKEDFDVSTFFFGDRSGDSLKNTTALMLANPNEELSAFPSFLITTSSPEVKLGPLETSRQDGGHDTKVPPGLFGDSLNISFITSTPTQDFSTNLNNQTCNPQQSPYTSTNSQEYQTCDSYLSSKLTGVSESNEILYSANSTLCGELSDVQKTPKGDIGPIRNLSEAFGVQDEMKGSLTVGLDSAHCSVADESVEKQCGVSALLRSHSEGSIAPAAPLQTSFGSDPGAIQELGLSSLTPVAPSLTPVRSRSQVDLFALPSFSSVSATPGAAQSSGRGHPELQEEPISRRISPHPVKPLTTATLAEEKRSVLATSLEKIKSSIHPGRSSQANEQETDRKKSLTEGAGSYYHLTHSELVALLVQREAELARQKGEFERQKLLLSKREVELKKLKPQVKDLEDYIDTLLVRIMEQKPTLLQVRSKFK